jgi:hypothetical protein
MEEKKVHFIPGEVYTSPLAPLSSLYYHVNRGFYWLERGSDIERGWRPSPRGTPFKNGAFKRGYDPSLLSPSQTI